MPTIFWNRAANVDRDAPLSTANSETVHACATSRCIAVIAPAFNEELSINGTSGLGLGRVGSKFRRLGAASREEGRIGRIEAEELLGAAIGISVPLYCHTIGAPTSGFLAVTPTGGRLPRQACLSSAGPLSLLS